VSQQVCTLAEAKPRILDGDGAYYRGSVSPVSRAIMVGGRGKYSHVGTFLWIDHELYIHEFREFIGCRLVRADREVRQYPGRIDHRQPRGVSYEQRQRVRSRALSKLGKRYDWGGILKAGRYHLPGLRWFVSVDEDDSKLTGPDDPEHCSYCRADLWCSVDNDLVPELANRITEPNDIARAEAYVCTLMP
jgi:hypothetical protein